MLHSHDVQRTTADSDSLNYQDSRKNAFYWHFQILKEFGLQLVAFLTGISHLQSGNCLSGTP
jgi:hypothetical protein